MPRKGTKRPPKPTYELACSACGEVFTATRSNASRCRTCIDIDRRPPKPKAVPWRDKVAAATLEELEADPVLRKAHEDLADQLREQREETARIKTIERMQALERLVEYWHSPTKKRRKKRPRKPVPRLTLFQLDPDPAQHSVVVDFLSALYAKRQTQYHLKDNSRSSAA